MGFSDICLGKHTVLCLAHRKQAINVSNLICCFNSLNEGPKSSNMLNVPVLLNLFNCHSKKASESLTEIDASCDDKEGL